MGAMDSESLNLGYSHPPIKQQWKTLSFEFSALLNDLVKRLVPIKVDTSQEWKQLNRPFLLMGFSFLSPNRKGFLLLF